MLRVLHIVTYMGRGGLETMLMNYYRNIDKTKVQFDFLVHRDFEADYDKEILSLGGKIFHVSRMVPWSRKYKNELHSFFNKHSEYKIVHIHQDCLSSVILKVAKEHSIQVRIAHSHNANQDKNPKYIIKLFYRQQIPKFATNLFSCGKDAGDRMFRGQPYTILNNAIDTRKYLPNERTRNKIRNEFSIEDSYLIGHVGRFNPQKNHTFLIEIFSEVCRIHSNCKLILIGTGDDLDEIKEKVKSMGLCDKVIFTGVRSDVNELMLAMDLFLFPSLYEGFPVTLVEAQAAGLPCVISDGVPNESIITSGLVTVCSLSSSARSWAEHIASRLSEGHSDHYSEIVKSGFDITDAAKKLEEFYISKYKELDA